MKRSFIVASTSTLTPNGGDGINYAMFYTGPNEGHTSQVLDQWAIDHGFKYKYWGSDTAYGMSGMYNGDTIVFYNSPKNMPAGYAEDAKKYGTMIEQAITQKDINSAVYDALSDVLFQFGESRVNSVTKEQIQIATNNFVERFFRYEGDNE